MLCRNPNDPQAQAQLRVGLAGLGGHEAEADAAQREAVRLCEERIRLNPTDYKAYMGLAWALPDGDEINVLRRKVELARKAIGLSPKRGALWAALARFQYKTRDWAGAIASAETALPLAFGNHIRTWLVLALAHARRGDMEKARPWYEMAARWVAEGKLIDYGDLWQEAQELFGPPPAAKDPPAAKPPPKP